MGLTLKSFSCCLVSRLKWTDSSVLEICLRCWMALGDPSPTFSLPHWRGEGLPWHLNGLQNAQSTCCPWAVYLYSGPNRAEIFSIYCWLVSGEFGRICWPNALVLLIYLLLEINRFSKFSLDTTGKWHQFYRLVVANKSYFPAVSHKHYNETLLNANGGPAVPGCRNSILIIGSVGHLARNE